MQNKIVAFADEFGNNSFDFENQGSHFIIASVIVNEEKLESLRETLETIRKRYFQTGEIKSRSVASNARRRKIILNELIKLDFSIYAVIVDKRKLYSEGFQYKQSFYKFLNGLVYKELYRTFPELTLYVDEHGENDFMRSFKSYVQKNHIRSLFAGAEFELHSSDQNIVIQLADFIAGTLGYIYDESKKGDDSAEFYNIISPKINSLNFFPVEYRSYTIDESAQTPQYDPVIATLALNRAADFIDTVRIKGQEEIDQVNCVKLLLLYNRAYNLQRFVSTAELLNHLNINRSQPLKEQYFRTKVIGRIRDNGVLIASSSDGYKLPSNSGDMKKFINHGKRIILPMLHRLKLCKEAILLATNNEMNILDIAEFKELDKILKQIK